MQLGARRCWGPRGSGVAAERHGPLPWLVADARVLVVEALGKPGAVLEALAPQPVSASAAKVVSISSRKGSKESTRAWPSIGLCTARIRAQGRDLASLP